VINLSLAASERLKRKFDRLFVRAFINFTTLALAASGCVRPPAVSPEKAFREVAPTEIEVGDDLDLSGLAEAITLQQGALKKSAQAVMRFGSVTISRADYSAALDKLLAQLSSTQSAAVKLDYIKNNFRFFEFYGGREWGEVLLTSYFEPIIPGSLRRSERFSQALYARPSDLVVIDLKQFSPRFKDEGSLRGRINQGRVVPYFSRSEIDDEKALEGKRLELCWVDPIDAFFAHIQGSCTVTLQNGKDLHVTYADKNGLKYEPIGKYLKEQIAPNRVTMQRIEAVARNMTPAERSALFAKNPSYVFFTISRQRALTSLGVPATPGRTIAADPKFAPKGALALISFNKPVVSNNWRLSDGDPPTTRAIRLVVDQDSGGAITGTDHIDLFWGRGDEAKRVAGILQDRARIVYLAPK